LLQLTALIGASLETLAGAVEISRTFFTAEAILGEEAQGQIAQAGVKEILASFVSAMPAAAELNEEAAKGLITQVTKEHGVKKGVVMRSLRAALSGEVHGPDLIQSWLLLHQQGLAVPRIQKALS
jgi:glutamyl-tRNA synthetase